MLGAGWYGCHLALALLADGHDVELHEISDRLFSGASGSNPARLHIGTHYPRSRLTRAACQEHHAAFMKRYGFLTRAVPINIYAVAAQDSWVDWGTYKQVLQGEVEFITIEQPQEFGLFHVEGAMLTGERHIVIDEAREYFTTALGDHAQLNTPPGMVNDARWDLTIDCTFCAMDGENIDRYEPCVTALLEGRTDKAVTIMDGPFPSLYPWNEQQGLNSLTSAKYTPLAKCATRAEAEQIINTITDKEVTDRCLAMHEQIAYFWPEAESYTPRDCKLSIRAMPRSGADARLVDVVRVGPRALRVRAGKIDAILHAEAVIKEMLCLQ